MSKTRGNPRRVLLGLGLLLLAAGAAAGMLLGGGETPAVVQKAEDMPPLDTAPLIRLHVTTVDGTESTLTGADLEGLGLWTTDTRTYWPDDEGPFSGPRLRDVLAATGLDGAEAVRLTAADDYSIVIPRADWLDWPVLLATRDSGKAIPVEDKGPLRVIYPRDLDPALDERVYGLRSAWMVERIAPAPADAVTR
ncbi:molybdopterin-dependent oxidoreductase [Caenispirillum salinarum]|uniref:molybdopterin-dependent oxidoreductase n=1 Tax=Caenispirillum salinarum TaxID=859058 RepID=UPI00384FAC2A